MFPFISLRRELTSVSSLGKQPLAQCWDEGAAAGCCSCHGDRGMLRELVLSKYTYLTDW